MLLIPFKDLATETLVALLEEIVSRDGTDYGEDEYSLAEKVAQLQYKLQLAQVFLCFDAETESCAIVAKEQLPSGLLAQNLEEIR